MSSDMIFTHALVRSYKSHNFSKNLKIMATAKAAELPPHAFNLYLVDTRGVSFFIIFFII
jgi:hypothetical protein